MYARQSRSAPSPSAGMKSFSPMHIDVIGDESISRQARTYAEYRLFAALSALADSSRVRRAALVLRPAKSRRHFDMVLCTVTVELKDGEVARLRACGDHPYAAINRAVDRLRCNGCVGRHESHSEWPSPNETAVRRHPHFWRRASSGE